MSKLVKIVIVLGIACTLHRDNIKAAVVYDYKSAPATACQVRACSSAASFTLAHNYDMSYGTALIMPTLASSTDYCYTVCPIVRDDTADSAGVRSAHVELYNHVSPMNTITCWVTATALSTSDGQFYQANGPQLGLGYGLNWSSLTLSAPTTIPGAPTGTTFANGSLAIICKMYSADVLISYGWVELGGNSVDW